jgi:hypothetical protein
MCERKVTSGTMMDHDHASGLHAVLFAVAAEVGRLAEHDVDPTDQMPTWLLEALPQPDGKAWLGHARDRWAPIVSQLRSKAPRADER